MPASASPSSASECPCPYTSAVSKKLHPSSYARRTARCDSASSVGPYEFPNRLPPIAQPPKPTGLTDRPVRPSTRALTPADPRARRGWTPEGSRWCRDTRWRSGARRSLAPGARDLDAGHGVERPVHGTEQRGAVQGELPRAAGERFELAVEQSPPLLVVRVRPEAREHERRHAVRGRRGRVLHRLRRGREVRRTGAIARHVEEPAAGLVPMRSATVAHHRHRALDPG